MSGPHSPVLARLKRGVRAAVQWCGGVDGAGATAGRSRTTAGEWNALGHPAFPPLDCALALDEAAIAQGHCPPILTALASELGHVAIPLPDGASGDELGCGVVALAAELGDVAARLREADRDGRREIHELEAIDREVTELLGAGAGLQALLRREIAAMRGGKGTGQ